MTDKPYIKQTDAQQIRSWILTEMLTGAGKAALVLIGIGVVLYAIYLVSLILPEESKQAPAPMPQSAIEAPATPTQLG